MKKLTVFLGILAASAANWAFADDAVFMIEEKEVTAPSAADFVSAGQVDADTMLVKDIAALEAALEADFGGLEGEDTGEAMILVYDPGCSACQSVWSTFELAEGMDSYAEYYALLEGPTAMTLEGITFAKDGPALYLVQIFEDAEGKLGASEMASAEGAAAVKNALDERCGRDRSMDGAMDHGMDNPMDHGMGEAMVH